MSFLIGLFIGFLIGLFSFSDSINKTARAFNRSMSAEVKYKAKKPREN